MRVPFPYVLPVAAYRFVSQFRYACSRGASWIVREPVWWLQAVAGIPQCLRVRKPVRWPEYRAWLHLPEVCYAKSEANGETKPRVATVESAL